MAETINQQRRLSRRTFTLLVSAAIAAVTMILLIYERLDILYILATLALVALLVVVATADLEGRTKSVDD